MRHSTPYPPTSQQSVTPSTRQSDPDAPGGTEAGLTRARAGCATGRWSAGSRSTRTARGTRGRRCAAPGSGGQHFPAVRVRERGDEGASDAPCERRVDPVPGRPEVPDPRGCPGEGHRQRRSAVGAQGEEVGEGARVPPAEGAPLDEHALTAPPLRETDDLAARERDLAGSEPCEAGERAPLGRDQVAAMDLERRGPKSPGPPLSGEDRAE